ncbi:cytochrome P450 [Auricularia subglabra TFB-10046 SS5]|nr:cytochrome P450 [Auricularia subglabra TFB-10046 SS5]
MSLIPPSLGSALLAAGCLLCAAVLLHKRRHVRRPYPPGPPETSYILGNVSAIPQPPEEWKSYQALSKRYGPVLHLRALGRHIIVLDSLQAAVDLLERRGANYSDRSRMPLIGELMGYGWHVTLMRYGDFWRLHRRALHQHLNEAALARLHITLEQTNARFLKALADTPGDWWDLLHWLAGASILSAVYGMDDTQLKDDPWIRMGEDALQMANDAFVSGFRLVDIFPVLKYVPAWLPGAGFKRKAQHAHVHSMRSRDEPIAWVRAQIEAGTARPSVASALMDAELDGVPLLGEVVANCTGVAYIAGADTTLSAMKAFVKAMILNPDVKRKAQEEIDRVLPADRLPTLADRSKFSLPYLEAVLCETYRLYPPVPLGVPHQSMQEDGYEGLRIPAGAVLIANIWSMLRDEKTYPDPLCFRPERFLTDGHVSMDPRSVVFGFGRRICPGRYFADSEFWLMAATILHAFDVLPAQDADGEVVLPTEGVVGAFVV